MRDFNPAETFGYLNSLISKSACDTDRPCYLMPRNPTKGARTDAATTALGGGGHRTEGHESGPWHKKSIVPAVVCQCLFSRAAGLEACEVPMVDGHTALEAALPTATAQWGSRKAGKNFMHPGIPNLF